MGLDAALSIASNSLANIQTRLSLVSNNVANAATPDYTRETSSQENLVAGSVGMGVRGLGAARAVDAALQQSVFAQSTTVSGLKTTAAGLAGVDAVLGTPGQGSDLGGLLGKVQDAFSSLMLDPSNGPGQAAVVAAARGLTGGIGALSTAYTQQRQAAQDTIVSAVDRMNTRLSRVGSLSSQIVAARSAGQSSADLENRRDTEIHALSDVLGIKTLAQPNGDMIVTTLSGTQLPTRAATGPVSTSNAVLGPEAYYPGGGLPPISVNGVDIAARIQGGELGAAIALRDKTLPGFQAELDAFSFSLATRFDTQGVTLFTDPSGAVPTGGGSPTQTGYVGFASIIQVNPAVEANMTLIRDGTHDVAGSPAGPSAFTVNPAGGPAGFDRAIDRVLKFALGKEAQSGVPWPAEAASGLGPGGTLSVSYAMPASLADHAAVLVSAQAGVSAAASGQLESEQAVQTVLTKTLADKSGVNMDKEMADMIQLQNAYGANARIIGMVQSMFSQLLQAVQ